MIADVSKKIRISRRVNPFRSALRSVGVCSCCILIQSYSSATPAVEQWSPFSPVLCREGHQRIPDITFRKCLASRKAPQIADMVEQRGWERAKECTVFT